MATKAWVYPERQFELIGAVRWQATWEEVKPSAQGKDDIDIDADIAHKRVNFKSKEEAFKYGREILDAGKTAFGQVTVTEQVVDWFVREDRIAEWRDTENEEYVD